MIEPKYEQRLTDLFSQTFETNHPAMHDWILIKFELKELRLYKKIWNKNNDRL